MADIRKPFVTRYVDASGKRCKSSDSGARKVKTESRQWYAFNVPGQRKPVPLSRNKTVAQEMLGELLRRAERKTKQKALARLRPPPPTWGYVYLAAMENACKIGVAQDVAGRVRELQTGTPGKLEVRHVIRSNDAGWLEAMLHRLFASRRLRGEWFALTEEDVSALKTIDVWERGQEAMQLVPVGPLPFLEEMIARVNGKHQQEAN